ncbi:O-antigen ligase family protein [Rhodoferax sp.]|uniref:O-antigen ligase family protein n=1 Tax=Rhodoferax sp. TaxID=50421 RepID=UPI00276D4F5F|nr:O-antigen ligase family protein [Rhodoferax sp.]
MPALRLVLVGFAALSVGLPVIFIGAAKFSLLVGAMVVLALESRTQDRAGSLSGQWLPIAILTALAVLALSMLWTSASSQQAAHALAKHAKLIVIPILVAMIRSRREALVALTLFVSGQLLLLGGTYLLVLGVPLPWLPTRTPDRTYALFSTYLDQSVLTAVFAALCWHLRRLIYRPVVRWLPALVSIMALICVFFVFQGRTGHLVAIAMVSMAIMWELPQRWRLLAVASPVLVLAALTASSDRMHTRFSLLAQEVHVFAANGVINSSSGLRLNLWRRATQAIAERPLAGSGVGSWPVEFDRLEKQHGADPSVDLRANPHQEYLLWGVELGALGLLLLAAIFGSAWHDALSAQRDVRRAQHSVLIALCVAALFNSALYDALMGDFFCVTLGILIALGRHTPSMQPRAANPI